MADALSDAQPTASMAEFLAQQEALEKEAAEILPGDVTHCTYREEYVTQQVYSCKTCFLATKQLAGVCFACFVSCHQDHDVEEMYTKRDFRCDCGNSKFAGECELQPAKDPTNSKNVYTHNFEGKYCVCDSPYVPSEGAMLKCSLCEDWFHEACLNMPDSPDVWNTEEGDEYVCSPCFSKHDFLAHYLGTGLVLSPACRASLSERVAYDVPLVVGVKRTAEDNNGSPPPKRKNMDGTAALCGVAGADGPEAVLPPVRTGPLLEGEHVDVTCDGARCQQSDAGTSEVAPIHGKRFRCQDCGEVDFCEECYSGLAHTHAETDKLHKTHTWKQIRVPVKPDGIRCVIDPRPPRPILPRDFGVFCLVGWRDSLCTCDLCRDILEAAHLAFLLDSSDLIAEDEADGAEPESARELEMDALRSLDPMVVAQGAAHMDLLATKFKEFLRALPPEAQKSVSTVEIQAFFEQMRNQ